jgi:hypothetical protein
MKTFTLQILVLALLVLPSTARASAVQTERVCPAQKLETCRWRIEMKPVKTASGRTIQTRWEKSVVTRHRERPYGAPIECNVDRGFNETAKGYIHVWFKGEKGPCDPTKRNPADCGVTFLYDVPGDPLSVAGFDVAEPAGKTLAKVEHASTLLVQCGDLTRDGFDDYTWDTLLGWKAGGAGDGSYSVNAAPVPRP